MKKAIVRTLFSFILGKKFMQPVFEKMLQFSLLGMNIGEGANPHKSGEKNVIRYVKKKYKDAAITIFDVGANIGSYSLFSKKHCPNAQIFAFEPSVHTYNVLAKNVSAVSAVKAVNLGLSDAPGTLTLFSDDQGSSIASLYQRDLAHYSIHFNRKEEVRLSTVDLFCKENNIPHIHFLKIDVEGHELKVLKGAEGMIGSGAVDLIQFEFGGTSIDAGVYFKNYFTFLNSSYRIYRIIRNGFRAVDHYTEVHEQFLATNFLAIKRSLL